VFGDVLASAGREEERRDVIQRDENVESVLLFDRGLCRIGDDESVDFEKGR
jgi:hypothetical protein